MKKVFWALLAVVGAYVAWVKLTEDRDDRDLWAEVTDTLDDVDEPAGATAEDAPTL